MLNGVLRALVRAVMMRLELKRWLVLLLLAAAMGVQAAPSVDERLAAIEDGKVSERAVIDAEIAAIARQLPPDSPLRWRLQRLQCWYQDTADLDAALSHAVQQRQAAEQAAELDAAIDFRLCHGQFLSDQEDNQAALAEFSEALLEAEALGHRRLEADARSLRGDHLVAIGRLGEGLVELQRAYDLYRQLGLDIWADYTLESLASLYRRMGEFEQAMDYYQQLQALSKARGDQISAMAQSLQIGFVLDDMGRHEEALALFRDVRQFHQQRQETDGVAIAEANIGMTLTALGRYQEALAALALARQQSRALPQGRLAIQGYLEGVALAGLGQHEAALRGYDEAEPLIRDASNNRYLALLHKARAESLMALGRHAEANAELLAHIAVHEQLDEWRQEQQASRLRVEFDLNRREAETAALKAEQQLQQERLAALEQRRQLQGALMVVGGLLFAVVAGLAWRHLRRARRYQRLAMTDELTGLANRRQIEALAQGFFAGASDTEQPLALLVFDIDYFKRINDSYGHAAGDQVLTRVSSAIRGQLRLQDRVGRTGGEEFLVLMPGSTLPAALAIAERLRQAVERLVLDEVASGLKVTISLGVTVMRQDDLSLAAMITRADNALYRAKDSGRNRVEAEA